MDQLPQTIHHTPQTIQQPQKIHQRQPTNRHMKEQTNLRQLLKSRHKREQMEQRWVRLLHQELGTPPRCS